MIAVMGITGNVGGAVANSLLAEGRNVRAVVRDVPRAIALSLALTLLMVLAAFRRGPYLAAVLFTLAVGCGGVACFLLLADVKLNFLNFAALPITFGIGVDYAVNVAQRYEADRGKDILGEVLRTGSGTPARESVYARQDIIANSSFPKEWFETTATSLKIARPGLPVIVPVTGSLKPWWPPSTTVEVIVLPFASVNVKVSPGAPPKRLSIEVELPNGARVPKPLG